TSSWWSTYEISLDEGIELGKALLVANGFHIYRDIWNDQPPLFSHAIAFLEVFELGSVASARTLVLLCSCLLLRSLFRIVRREHGSFAAWMVVLLLAGSSKYGQLSVPVLAGLPAISLTVIALDVSTSANRTANRILAGVLFGLSMQVKLFTVVIAPALFLGVFLFRDCRIDWALLRRYLEVGTSILATYLLVIWIIDIPVLEQVWQPNFAEELRLNHSYSTSFLAVVNQIFADFPVIILAAMGTWWMLSRRKWIVAVPLLWFIIAFVSLVSHTPVWWHHVLLLEIPLAWLAGVFVAQLPIHFWQATSLDKRLFRVALIVAAAGLISYRAPISIGDESNYVATNALAKQARNHKGWVLSDRPMDAYRAGLLVPPELVVFSGKRRRAGNLTTADILTSIKKRIPAQVLLRRFEINPEVRGLLQKAYKKVPNSADLEHYVLTNPERILSN
ncbi:MAG: glycosyltransferase family 39 protein, partial [Pseudomonadota bacterium]